MRSPDASRRRQITPTVALWARNERRILVGQAQRLAAASPTSREDPAARLHAVERTAAAHLDLKSLAIGSG